MAAEAPAIVISAIAAADLSAGQYRGVKVTAAQSVNFVAASTDSPTGVSPATAATARFTGSKGWCCSAILP